LLALPVLDAVHFAIQFRLGLDVLMFQASGLRLAAVGSASPDTGKLKPETSLRSRSKLDSSAEMSAS
jgi:hypothetical protein